MSQWLNCYISSNSKASVITEPYIHMFWLTMSVWHHWETTVARCLEQSASRSIVVLWFIPNNVHCQLEVILYIIIGIWHFCLCYGKAGYVRAPLLFAYFSTYCIIHSLNASAFAEVPSWGLKHDARSKCWLPCHSFVFILAVAMATQAKLTLRPS